MYFILGKHPHFACRQSGHTRANCPRAIASVIPADDAAADETVPPLLSPARDDIVKTLMGSVVNHVVDHTHAIPPQAPLLSLKLPREVWMFFLILTYLSTMMVLVACRSLIVVRTPQLLLLVMFQIS